MPSEPRFSPGEVVVIHDPRLAEQLGREGQVGVVINTRRGGARVLFLPDRATFWTDEHRLYPHPQPSEVASPQLLHVARALAVIEPEEAEVDSVASDGSLTVQALALRFDANTPHQLRQELGDALLGWEIIPYGMALITVVLRIGPA